MSIEVKPNGMAPFRVPDGTTREEARAEVARRRALLEAAPAPASEEVDRGMATLLKFIRNTETSIGEGYTQIVGKNKTKDLPNMTLDEVMAFQKKDMTKAKGFESTAVGAYQFTRGTLSDLMRWLELDGSEKMTPDMQDRLAVRLLVKQGMDEWVAGDMTDDEFGNKLAERWASFPVLTDHRGRKKGKSFFGGIGTNKALVTVDQVLNKLDTQKDEGLDFSFDAFVEPEVAQQEPEFEVPTDELGTALEAQEGDPQLDAAAGDDQAALDPSLKDPDLLDTSLLDVVQQQPLEADALPIDGEPDQQVAEAQPDQQVAEAQPAPEGISVPEDLIADATAPVEPNPTIVGQDDTLRPSLDEKIRSTLV